MALLPCQNQLHYIVYAHGHWWSNHHSTSHILHLLNVCFSVPCFVHPSSSATVQYMANMTSSMSSYFMPWKAHWKIVQNYIVFFFMIVQCTLMCLSIGPPKIIEFPFVLKGKLMVLGVSIFMHISIVSWNNYLYLLCFVS